MTSPLFTIVTPVYDTPLDVLAETVDSVRAQRFREWEWILVDDRSPDPAIVPALERHSAADDRIRVIRRDANGGIVAASNDAVAAATGTFIALLDHDDLLTPDALAVMAAAIAQNPDDVDYLYSDEDKVLPDGAFGHAFLKPDWSPERFRHQMYTSHLSVLRTSLVREVGGFRAGFDGSQDWDLVLRVTERARRIHHVPRVLYHWRMIAGSTSMDAGAKPYALEAGARAVAGQFERLGIDATIQHRPDLGVYEVTRAPDLTTSTSIIIPTRGTAGRAWGSLRTYVVDAVRSVRERTAHVDLEFVVVYDDPSTPQHVLDELSALPGVDLVLVPFDKPFNFSEKCNVGALHARGDVLIFLNDDVEAASDEVIGQLIAPLSEPDVGITGAKLLFENGRIQHAGVEYGSLNSAKGSIRHSMYRALPSAAKGPDLHMNRETSALTGACIAMRADVFHDAGGFTEQLPINFNDIDLCLKVRRNGLRLVWLCRTVLWHFESISRSTTVHKYEVELMVKRWGPYASRREKFFTRNRLA
ncbi:glycosyltransferase family 2 protein [Aeromicrobium endophyticum]|uniref:glycosyltransferase family 2 protein n=1 Tax=Aeromicrobium endophyticum TaxID=2292704 RepID=UPI0018F53B88|nr:glycosyltransferase [Aeromicrobium endophyticum]